MSRPVFSIVTPVFNGARFLSETIQSVLDSGFEDLELIIVDDGSTDNSLSIARDFVDHFGSKIQVLQHEKGVNRGVSASRSLAVSKSNGEYVFFLDADDILLNGTLERYQKVFESEKGVGLIHGNVLINSELSKTPSFDGFNLGSDDKRYCLSDEEYFLKRNRINNSTVAVRSELIKKVDFSFDQVFQVEDWVLWNILSSQTLFYYCSDFSTRYRFHSSSASYDISNSVRNKRIYAKLEMLLATITLVSDSLIRRQVAIELLITINTLLKSYGAKFSNSILSFLPFRTLLRTIIRKCSN